MQARGGVLDRIGVIGTSYRTTKVENLAAATLPSDFGTEAMVELAQLAGFSELVYLATCNRVEFYFRIESHSDTPSLLFHLRRTLADLTEGVVQLPTAEELYIHRGEDAVRHLFRVTAALDSMMVGEAQIAGQVKEAHERAHKMDLLGGILDQSFHESFNLAKRVRSETELARRPVSLVTLVERTLQEHLAATSAPALILGAGEMAAQTLRLIRGADRERRVVVANRTPGRADELVAPDPAAFALPMDSTLSEPPRVGLVVAATSSPEVVLTRDHLSAIRQHLPQDEPVLVVDLAMPPNVDPTAATLPGVTLVGIEAMRAEAERNRQLRMQEMDRCESLVDHQLLILRRRLLDRALSPVARTLHTSFQDVAERALEYALAKDLAHLTDDDRAALERMADALVKRLVQVPLRGLKGTAWEHSIEVLESFVKGVEDGDRPRDREGD